MNGASDSLLISFTAQPEMLPPLPAAVEVAAYRIAQESLTNILRHSQAKSCSIEITFNNASNDSLELKIEDDGIGLPEKYRSGVGITSMQERAAELGGWCTVKQADSVGTQVLACLPVRNKTK
jgi:signal transduction histidine kinase